MRTTVEYLFIGLGGFLGANARYVIGGWVARVYGGHFPYGTLLINVSGSFLLGFLVGFLQDRPTTHPNHRLFFAIGFLGAYTTFSTFTAETLRLMQDGHLWSAAIYVFSSVLIGIVGVFLGLIFGSSL
jgi:CrcB protein